MQPVTRQRHGVWQRSVIQTREHTPKLGGELRVNAFDASRSKQRLEAFMSEAPNHFGL
jgi:hypothetical protein